MKKINLLSIVCLMTVLVLTSCGSSKKASAPEAASTELSDIDSKVSMLAGDASFSEKSADIKTPEKGTIKIFYGENGSIQKIEKDVTSAYGAKVSKYYFSDNNLIYSNHYEKNTTKVKGKVLFTDTKYYFGNNKVLGAVQKSVTLKPSAIDGIEMKMAKEKFKAIAANPNMLRDEMIVIKKLKSMVK